MLSERLLTTVIRQLTGQYLRLSPAEEVVMPNPQPGKKYMLYMHVPFCERLCPYCSFNRFPYSEERARPYFKAMREEMRMLQDIGYDFESVYIGGGTPTILLDELCDMIDLAKELFAIKEVSSETNPNHLTKPILERLQGRVQRLSVGVQSFDDDLLRQMDRYEKYGSGAEILERIQMASPYFVSMNADMIFNFPAQSVDVLINDIERAIESGASQVTFYPLMASPSVQRSLADTVGRVDYAREQQFYEIICELLLGERPDGTRVADPLFELGSAWTFNRIGGALGGDAGASSADAGGVAGVNAGAASGSGAGVASCSPDAKSDADVPVDIRDSAGQPAVASAPMIDEYVVNYEEYPAIGSGGITYLGENLYVNTFSVTDYIAAIERGHMSIFGKTSFSKRDRMRYRFMMQLFGLRLDKRQFKEDFGVTVDQGLPMEMTFMRAAGAFSVDNDEELLLTPKGRYLTVVMMRQFFIGVNNLRDQAREALQGEEKVLLFGE